MPLEDIDRVLSEEHEILPSSGFAGFVMDAVRRDAAPIPFPWLRALPGLVVAAFAFVLVLGGALARGPGASVPPRASLVLFSALGAARSIRADWIVAALLLTLASVTLARRVAPGAART